MFVVWIPLVRHFCWLNPNGSPCFLLVNNQHLCHWSGDLIVSDISRVGRPLGPLGRGRPGRINAFRTPGMVYGSYRPFPLWINDWVIPIEIGWCSFFVQHVFNFWICKFEAFILPVPKIKKEQKSHQESPIVTLRSIPSRLWAGLVCGVNQSCGKSNAPAGLDPGNGKTWSGFILIIYDNIIPGIPLQESLVRTPPVTCCPLGIGVNETAPGPRSCNHSPHPLKMF